MTLKIAIIGMGPVVQKQYLPYLATVEDVALGYFNRTRSTAEEAAKLRSGVVLGSLEDVAAWKPDAALVLTAETVRDEFATALIELGLPRLFFEKPLVARQGQAHVTEDDFVRGRTLMHLAKSKGCETAMVFNYRFFDHTVKAKALIEERNLGRVVGFHGGVHYACWSHCIDMMLYLAGDVVEIAAQAGTVKRPIMDAVEVAGSFLFACGAGGTLLGTSGTGFAMPLYDLTFLFENGSIRLLDLDGPLELVCGSDGQSERFAPGHTQSRWPLYDRSFQRSMAAYLASLRAGTPPPVPGMAGLKELQFEAAMKRSIAQKRTVDLEEEFAL